MERVLEFQQTYNMEQILKKSLYFKELEEQDFRALLRCYNARIVSYLKNETIVNIDDDASNIYIIISGHARSKQYDISGKEFIYNEYYADDIFGIEYLSQGLQTFKEELKALDNCIVLICNGFRFLNPCENRCKRHIDSLRNSILNISKFNITSTSRIHTMCQSKTRIKIMTYLNKEANNKRSYFQIPYTQSELAIYLGLERSALSLELNKLKKEGIIDFDDKLYRIKKKKL